MRKLAGRVIFFTGSGRGIGRTCAMRLADEGAAIIIADMLLDNAQEVASEISSHGGQALAIATDVSNWDSVDESVRVGAKQFGRIDGLINNAAMLAGVQRRSFLEIPESEWDRMMAVNVKGLWNCCKAVVPHMREAGGGKIVNISSDTVLSGVPGLLHYVGSKGAIWAMTRSLCRELGPDGICVNAIAPGFTVTEAALEHGGEALQRSVAGRALARPQTPGDLAGTLSFLISSDSDFLTGELLTVNGGYVFH